MYKVTKRDGKVADFHIAKISEAIKKAFDACERQYNDDVIDFLALKVSLCPSHKRVFPRVA